MTSASIIAQLGAKASSTATKQVQPSGKPSGSVKQVSDNLTAGAGLQVDVHPMRDEPSAIDIVLHNPHNLCYMNANILAIMHLYAKDTLPPGLRQLRALLHGAQGRALNLAQQLVVASLTRGWSGRISSVSSGAASATQSCVERPGSRTQGHCKCKIVESTSFRLYFRIRIVIYKNLPQVGMRRTDSMHSLTW